MRHVRLADAGDAEAIAAIYAPIVRDTAISFETEPPTPAEMAARIAGTLPRFPWLVMADDDAVLGYAYASSHRERAAYRWSVDVTVYVGETARGQGVGSALYAVLFDSLRRQGFRSAFAGIALPNPGSIALHESVGFRPLGVYDDVGFKLGAWRSVGWWRLPISEADGEPSEPIPFAQVRGDPALGL